MNCVPIVHFFLPCLAHLAPRLSRPRRTRTRDSLAPGTHVSRTFRPEMTGRGFAGNEQSYGQTVSTSFGNATSSFPTGAAQSTSTSLANSSLPNSRRPGRYRPPHAVRPVERLAGRPAHAPRTAVPHDFSRTAALDPNVARQKMELLLARRRQLHDPPKFSSRTLGTQSDFRESEAQTVPYAPGVVLPSRPSSRQRALNEKHAVPDGRPEVLTLLDNKYDTGEQLSAADVDRVRKMRAKRLFEQSLPPLSDTESLPLRRQLMQEWEEAEWAEREREIALVQETRLDVLISAIDAREMEAESVAERRLQRMLRGALDEKRKKFDALQTKRVRGLRKLERRRAHATEESKIASEGVFAEQAGRVVSSYASYASTAYAPLQREGRVDPLNTFSVAQRGTDFVFQNQTAFDDDRRRSALDTFLDLERSIPGRETDVGRTIRAADLHNRRVTGGVQRSTGDDDDNDSKNSNEENEDVSNATKVTNSERLESLYFTGLDKTAETLKLSKKHAGGDRGVGAVWPAPLTETTAEQATLKIAADRQKLRDEKVDTGPSRVERPETPELEPPLDEMAPEFHAVVLLQRLLRGIHGQLTFQQGIARRRALIAELRADETDEEFFTDSDGDVEEFEDDDSDSLDDPLDGPADDGTQGVMHDVLVTVARATSHALSVLAIANDGDRNAAYQSTRLAVDRLNARREKERHAAHKIQAAHRGRLARRAADAVALQEQLRDETLATSVVADVTGGEGAGPAPLAQGDLVACLSSPEREEVRLVQTAARAFVQREARLEFLLLEASAAAADVDLARLDGNIDAVRTLQVTARAHVSLVASTRAIQASEDLQDGDSRSSANDPSTATQTTAQQYLTQALGANASVGGMVTLPASDRESVRRQQASARALVAGKGEADSENETPSTGRSLEKEVADSAGSGFGIDYDHHRVTLVQAVARGRAVRREFVAKRNANLSRTESVGASEKHGATLPRKCAEEKQEAIDSPKPDFENTDSPSLRLVKIEADFAETAEQLQGTPVEQAAAVSIQAALRGAEGRRLARLEKRRRSDPAFRKARADAASQRAAIKIQAAHRGSVARRSVAEMRLQMREEHEAAGHREDAGEE